jgi:hypothetical protein
MVTTDILSELASAIVEREWYKTHWESDTPDYEAENGDIHYIDEVQDEFNEVLDLLDEILNGATL